MTFTTRICCPTCKKQTEVEISEAQFAQIRKEVVLKQKAGNQKIRDGKIAANSEVHFSSTANQQRSAIQGGSHKRRQYRDYNDREDNKGGIRGVHSPVHHITVHCSGCDNLFTHQIPLHSLIEAEQAPQLTKSYSANNAHSRLYSVISRERKEKSSEPPGGTDSTVETLTQHFDSFTAAQDLSSYSSNTGRSLLYPKSVRSGTQTSRIAQIYALTRRWLKIMIETTAFKLLFPSAAVLAGMMAMSMAPNSVFFRTLNAFWPPEHQVPESSVYIESTQAEAIETTSGKRFIAVTGTIRNDGTHPVRDVLIQGLVYQADGSRLHDAVGFAHRPTTPQNSPAFNDADIRTIQRSEIGQILNPTAQGKQKIITDISAIAQGNIPKRERELKAGQSQDFTIYIPVESNFQKENLLYSARIFAIS